MNLIKTHKNKIITAIAVVAVLVCAFLWGGSFPLGQESDTVINVATEAPTLLPTQSPQPKPEVTPDIIKTPAPKTVQTAEPKQEEKQTENVNSEQTETTENTENAETVTETVSEEVNQVAAEAPDKELTCTLSVRCDTINQNMELLDSGKAGLIPQSGTIFSERTVTFYEGESVFNLLTREMKKNGIHLEFVNVPVYNSAYIEGIANIYEFDCGELSGWMYKVNGHFPNYGCSSYQLKAGDRVEFVYTCDLGNDVGGGYSARNGM